MWWSDTILLPSPHQICGVSLKCDLIPYHRSSKQQLLHATLRQALKEVIRGSFRRIIAKSSRCDFVKSLNMGSTLRWWYYAEDLELERPLWLQTMQGEMRVFGKVRSIEHHFFAIFSFGFVAKKNCKSHPPSYWKMSPNATMLLSSWWWCCFRTSRLFVALLCSWNAFDVQW